MKMMIKNQKKSRKKIFTGTLINLMNIFPFDKFIIPTLIVLTYRAYVLRGGFKMPKNLKAENDDFGSMFYS